MNGWILVPQMLDAQLEIHFPEFVRSGQINAGTLEHEGLVKEGSILKFVINISKPGFYRAWLTQYILLVFLIVRRLLKFSFSLDSGYNVNSSR